MGNQCRRPRPVQGALGHVSRGGQGGLNWLVYGQPAVKTPLLTLSLGHKASRLHPQWKVEGACKGPISCKGGWRNYPAKVVMNYRKEEGGGGPRISYV